MKKVTSSLTSMCRSLFGGGDESSLNPTKNGAKNTKICNQSVQQREIQIIEEETQTI
jgi:hypothetical protein